MLYFLSVATLLLYREDDKITDVQPQPPQKYNTIWGQHRIYNICQKQKIHAEANAENTSGRHHVVIHHVAG